MFAVDSNVQLPRMQEPRGSLGAECVGNALLAISGSGIASNLDSCEVLEVSGVELPATPTLGAGSKDVEEKAKALPELSENSAPGLAAKPASSQTVPWFKVPPVTIARHALTTTVMPGDPGSGMPTRVFATGGWKYGNQVTFMVA